MIQTGETKSQNKRNKESGVRWHMEDTEHCAPICVVAEGRPGRIYLPAKYMTTNWEYVTCPKCLALKNKKKEEKDV